MIATLLNNAGAGSCVGNGVGIKEEPKGSNPAGDRKSAILGWLYLN